MALIKQAKSQRLTKQAIVLDMGDLGRQAERLLAAARTEAARITEDAHARAQQLIDQADQRGYTEGMERGLIEGRDAGHREGREKSLAEIGQQLGELTRQWTAALHQWESDRRDMFQDAREDVIRFAFEIARKIVHRVSSSDPGIVIDQVVAALAMVGRTTSVEIAIHPQDRPFVESVLPQLVQTVSGCAHASLRDEPSLLRGGCVVRTAGGGHIDASIQTQLDRIAEALVPPPREFKADAGGAAQGPDQP